MNKPNFGKFQIELNSTKPRVTTRHTLVIVHASNNIINPDLHVVVESSNFEDLFQATQWEWEDHSLELEQICRLLECTIDELLEWVRNQIHSK